MLFRRITCTIVYTDIGRMKETLKSEGFLLGLHKQNTSINLKKITSIEIIPYYHSIDDEKQVGTGAKHGIKYNKTELN